MSEEQPGSAEPPSEIGSVPGCVASRIGLRERKKQRTRETIARVALDLFDRQGFRATTIAQIADAADVSPRTVSAYFPVKEDLLFPDREQVFDRLAARLGDRLPGELAADALRAWIVDNAEEIEHKRGQEAERARRRVIDADESLRAYERHAMELAERLLASAIARDLGTAPDDLAPRLAAAAAVGALTSVGRFYDESDALGGAVAGPRAEGDSEAQHAAVLAHLDQAIVFLRGGIRELRAQRPNGGAAAAGGG